MPSPCLTKKCAVWAPDPSLDDCCPTKRCELFNNPSDDYDGTLTPLSAPSACDPTIDKAYLIVSQGDVCRP